MNNFLPLLPTKKFRLSAINTYLALCLGWMESGSNPRLKVQCFEDGALFLSRYDAFLHANEGMNSIILGNTLKSIFNPPAWKFVFMGVEEEDEGREAKKKPTPKGSNSAPAKVRLCALYFEALQCIFFSVGALPGDLASFTTLARYLHRNRVSVRECQGPVALRNDVNSIGVGPPPQPGIPYFVNLMNACQTFHMVRFMEVCTLVRCPLGDWWGGGDGFADR